jgi:hypothetical protein
MRFLLRFRYFFDQVSRSKSWFLAPGEEKSPDAGSPFWSL